jgi:hypothetical protein
MKAVERASANSLFEHDEPTDHALYEEYLRGFEAVPVLTDAVRIPPRRAPAPSFVRGERRSLRKAERPDGYSMREAHVAELASLYAEYAAPPAAKPPRKRRTKKKTVNSKPKPKRKSSGSAER